MKNSIRFLILIIVLFFYGGCIEQKVLPYPTHYIISEPKIIKSKKFINKSIKIMLPKAKPSLKSIGILYTKAKKEISSYNKSVWADKPVVLLYSHIYKTLLFSDAFRVILPQNSQALSDYILESDLLNLRQDFYNNKAKLLLEVKFDLIDMDKKEAVISKLFRYKIECDKNAKGAIKATNEAFDSLSYDLIKWIEENDI